jgi:bifunctional non-homologous end joining protein LigD
VSDGTGGLPAGLRPMLASPGQLPGDDEAGWAYELKWDGIRALAYLQDGQVRLVSRLGRDMTRAYPELHQLATQPAAQSAAQPATERSWSQAVLDGEIVAFDPAGRPSFELLQQRMHVTAPIRAARLAAAVPVTYLAFDLLSLDGRGLLTAGYASRRSALEGLGLPGPYWQVPPAFTGYRGGDVLAASGEHGLEGIVAKRLDSRYEPGTRSAAWRKVKNTYRQEVVIGGWKPGEGARSGQIGSLLIGVYGAAGDLAYAGHVGTGFTAVTLHQLGRLLGPLRTGSPPFRTAIPAEHARNVTWVQPRLVAEVEFAGWTSAGRMRAASYKGLRPDKDPAEVIREPGPPHR